MKAYHYNYTIVCPECGQIMLPHRETKTLRCVGRECALKDIEYHAPSVELVPVKQPDRVEYVIIHEET